VTSQCCCSMMSPFLYRRNLVEGDVPAIPAEDTTRRCLLVAVVLAGSGPPTASAVHHAFDLNLLLRPVIKLLRPTLKTKSMTETFDLDKQIRTKRNKYVARFFLRFSTNITWNRKCSELRENTPEILRARQEREISKLFQVII